MPQYPEKGGELRTQRTGGSRLLLAALLVAALVVAPILLLQAGPRVGARTVTAEHGGTTARLDDGARLPSWELAQWHRRTAPVPSLPAPATTVPTTAVTTTTAPPTTTVPPPTTTTAPPTTTTTAPPPAPAATGGDQESGDATWYAAAPPGMCASPSLPFGTELTVVNVSTGAQTTCTVDDREGDMPGRVVDLSPSNFSEIASTSQGVASVTVSWS